jgi:ABC-type branched-subunit amino acid transport system ATPase component
MRPGSSDTQPPRLELVEITKRYLRSSSRSEAESRDFEEIYLHSKILIPDEPTSVLTPVEGDEVLRMLRRMVEAKQLSVLIITHKFRT